MKPVVLPEENILPSARSSGVIPEAHCFGPVFRYTVLVVPLGLLASGIYWRIYLPSNYAGDRNGALIVSVGLILNHLTWCFRWPRVTRRVFSILAPAWLAFAVVYLCWSSVNHPGHKKEPVKAVRSGE